MFVKRHTLALRNRKRNAASRMKSSSAARSAPASLGPRRRPERGGYARGDEVRSRILLAAIELFGEQGFASASTRAIAARAGVNPPALQYYFHNKARLHQACGQYIADSIRKHLLEPMARAAEALESGDRSAAPEALWALVDTVMDHSSTEAEIPGWIPFVAQAAVEQTDNSLAVIHDHAVQPLFDRMAALIALAWGRPADDEMARLGAVLLLSQTRAFGTQKQVTLIMMGWPDLDQGRLGAAKRGLRALMDALIAKPL
jgi:AcrR family transcriptional regulator